MGFFILIYLFIIISFPTISIISIAKFGFAEAWEEFRFEMVASIICIPLLIITIYCYLEWQKEQQKLKARITSELNKTNEIIKKQEYFICPKCAFMRPLLPDKHGECNHCGTSMINTGLSRMEFDENTKTLGEKYKQRTIEELSQEFVYDNPLFDEEIYNERINVEIAEQLKRLEEEKRIHEQRALERYLDDISSSNRGLKCPICGSHYVVKIGALNRATSVHFWGLASSKIGKQYECKECRAKW